LLSFSHLQNSKKIKGVTMFKNNKYLPWLIATIAVLAAIAIPMTTSARMANAVSASDEAIVTNVNVTNTIEASGSIQARLYAELTWKTSGTVESVAIQVGDDVNEGDVLMSLRPSSTAANLITAEAELIQAHRQLDDLINPSGEAIAASQKQLASAYADWNVSLEDLSEALNGRSAYGDDGQFDDMTSAERELNDALDAFSLTANTNSQWYYWAVRMEMLELTVGYDYVSLAAELRESLDSDDAGLIDDIVEAQNKYEAAIQEFAESITEHAVSITINEKIAGYLQTSASLLDTSRATYETLVSPHPDDITTAQAGVDAALATLDSLNIVAPFAGEVLAIEHRPGDIVHTSEIGLVIADRSQLYIDAQVDEADISQIEIGAPVVITLDVMPGETLTGKVTFINPVGKTLSGLVKYTVTIDLDPIDEAVLLGATADVTVQAGEPESALAVPAAAVQSDSSGEFVYVIQPDGSTVRTNVQSSTSVNDLVIVSGNLNVGDRVQASYNGSNFQVPNPFGGE
jgi:RND family efflux transporter MFP subunit